MCCIDTKNHIEVAEICKYAAILVNNTLSVNNTPFFACDICCIDDYVNKIV
jgi:hypothetical protein